MAGLVALALLGLGEAAPAAWPVHVLIEAHGAQLVVEVDGQRHELSSALGGGWQEVDFESPGPVEREYQIDGSDTTATNDRRPERVLAWLHTPQYALDAWLRDESSYSRWEGVRVDDLTPSPPSAADAASAGPPAGAPGGAGEEGGLPAAFRVVADLRRPEAPARIWLLGPSPGDREGLELDRDHRNARWLIERGGVQTPLPRWFFPEQPAPFAAELLHLLGRSAMAAFGLLLAALLLARASRLCAVQRWWSAAAKRRGATDGARLAGWLGRAGAVVGAGGGNAVLAVWLLGAGLLVTVEFHQLPHILDAVSYSFQAAVFAHGALWLEPPLLADAFRGPFEVVSGNRWFSQYPPGAPAAYALGQLVGLSWLVGGLACVALIGATAYAAGALFGPAVRAAVLVLGALSPFVLFQSGSFLSHPIAGGLLAGALAAFVAGERSGRLGWFSLCGALLGAAFLSREAASVLFAVPLGARLLVLRRWRALVHLSVYGVPFVLLYLLYNDALTGSPWTLPRTLFAPSDHFGFGDGIGFHTRHTLAAGLVNTDELLTLWQFDALGWPPLFTYGLAALPFLLGRARAWDALALGGVLAFVVAYVAYFYHGIALGPRYYFEAMPWLLLLVARGAQVLAELARSRLAVGVLLGLLSLNTVLFYVPHEIERRADFSGLPDARPLRLSFVRSTPLGPRLEGVPSPALVLTNDWWLFNTALAALNCARLPNCPVVFGLALDDATAERLRAEYPGRHYLRAVEVDGRIILQPS